ncbi:MAG: ABC transporter substrate-binding protein [Anaerolineales bacterium]|jgi:ABC-type oligopeptide transport system substrate-binding subunit
MKNRFSKLAILVLILTVGLLAGCGGQIDEGNTSEMSLSTDIILDPAIAALEDEDSLTTSAYVYEGLMRIQDDGTVGPGIAAACDEADDGLSYQCSLRSDAVFSDGTPITADVVLDNFNRWYDPSDPLHGDDSDLYAGWKKYFKGFKDEVDADGKKVSLFDGIEKVNDLTVLIHLFEPMPDFLEILASPHFSILNPDALEMDGASYGTMEGSVVSSGPYLVSEWTDASLTLTPNGDYWGEQATEDMVFSLE